jgi:hypothetical protein
MTYTHPPGGAAVLVFENRTPAHREAELRGFSGISLVVRVRRLDGVPVERALSMAERLGVETVEIDHD